MEMQHRRHCNTYFFTLLSFIKLYIRWFQDEEEILLVGRGYELEGGEGKK